MREPSLQETKAEQTLDPKTFLNGSPRPVAALVSGPRADTKEGPDKRQQHAGQRQNSGLRKNLKKSSRDPSFTQEKIFFNWIVWIDF